MCSNQSAYIPYIHMFCTILVLIAMLNSCAGQISFHTDANENSYTIKTPGVQQSFTRYFGGQRGNLLQQPASTTAEQTAYTTAKFKANQAAVIEQQQQQQQQQQEYPYSNGSPAPSAYQQQSATDRYRSTYVQPYVQQSQPQQQQQSQLEQSSTALENLQSAYNTYQNHRQLYAQEHQLQQMQDQQRHRQQQQYQQHMLLQQLYQQNRPINNAINAQTTQQPNSQNHQQSGYYTAQQYAQYLQQQQDQVLKHQHDQLQQQYFQRGGNVAQQAQESVTEKVLGVQFSPSDQVSHVNFASGNLKYNF